MSWCGRARRRSEQRRRGEQWGARLPAAQIVARDLVKTYKLGGSVIGALQGISVTVERGEYLAVTGASGSGKSTFMNLVGALDVPTSGSLQIEGRELGRLSLGSARALPQREDRLCVPDLQSAGADIRARQCQAATASIRRMAMTRARQGQGVPRQGRPRASRGASAVRAFRRPTAARGDRPRARQRPAYPPRRRADRRARQPHHRGDHRAVRGTERRPASP